MVAVVEVTFSITGIPGTGGYPGQRKIYQSVH